MDERRIQEHFYNQDKNDIYSRFFQARTRFVRDDLERMFQIDYIKNLTLVAVVGEFGFGKVVAVGEYLLCPAKNIAEIAFSVSKNWQGKGLGKLLMRKLCESARENGISGLIAYTMPRNKGMIKLFKSLPYNVSTVHDGEVVELTCMFNEVK